MEKDDVALRLGTIKPRGSLCFWAGYSGRRRRMPLWDRLTEKVSGGTGIASESFNFFFYILHFSELWVYCISHLLTGFASTYVESPTQLTLIPSLSCRCD